MATVTLTPEVTDLRVDVSGIEYDYAEVYKLVSNPAPPCYGGLPVFDNNCASHTQVIDGSLYANIIKGSGASFTIPFNNSTFNGFGVNLVADGSSQSLLMIFYKNGAVWQYTFTGAFTAPVSTYIPPQCPNKPPVPFIWWYEGTKQMYFLVTAERDNCPVSMVIKKDNIEITSSNVQSLCGASAIMQVYPGHVILFNVDNGGVYTSTVTTNGGSGTASQTVAGAITAKPKGKK